MHLGPGFCLLQSVAGVFEHLRFLTERKLRSIASPQSIIGVVPVTPVDLVLDYNPGLVAISANSGGWAIAEVENTNSSAVSNVFMSVLLFVVVVVCQLVVAVSWLSLLFGGLRM